ncbi:DinB family protein [Croceitalea rosinachiae]|uniref:DinB family protein n=1 Tax=Croceitalea rosinachiae TaxID=3075596 RepID=A0ABU3AE52_9FLAO|nr:DinB family protein [Croceitalea sp. F388]MDT0608468.1 DinB family protein [Croceitalea sp. F388]
MTVISDLNEVEYHPYYSRYINKLDESTGLIESFQLALVEVVDFFNNIPSDLHLFRYEEGKWTIKEVFQHLIDTERIFMYRCFRIARNDKTVLADFDQSIYIQPSRANEKSIEVLIDEYQISRANSIGLLSSLTVDDLKRVGKIQLGPMSSRAAAFTITGHEIWHMEIINKRYL